MEATQIQPAAVGAGLEHKRCADIVDLQALHFERKKIFPVARALKAVAQEIRGVQSPPPM
ncbi:MAG: hypothetical protein EOS32_02005 [Mesorhizobium sp.]|uniref:hypothetical protein n=1 Tax=Mesorhizobium sp. TaxID=1871066 RepID=UPI000FE57031|nr:hypothetical protein [Mesorhizobium sp.]RWC97991.1 MAG: hypothetical protein EOS32_02005 [Mesorhizobium sp.]